MAKSLRGLRHALVLALSLAVGGCAYQVAARGPSATPLANQSVQAGDFVVVYPGVYTAREVDRVCQYLAGNAALKKRGPIDVQARVSGTLLVSDLNHSVTSYRPIHPGDTLYLVANERSVTDITPPEGSIYRSIVIRNGKYVRDGGTAVAACGGRGRLTGRGRFRRSVRTC